MQPVKPMFNGLDLSKGHRPSPHEHEWDFVKRLRDTVERQAAGQGRRNAGRCTDRGEHGVDGLIVSNHGGRAGRNASPTVESLPEVIEGVAGKIPIIVDAACGAARTFSRPRAGRVCGRNCRPHAWGLARLASRALRPYSRSCAENCAHHAPGRNRLG